MRFLETRAGGLIATALLLAGPHAGILSAAAGAGACTARAVPSARTPQSDVVELLEISGVLKNARAETDAVVSRLRLENPQVPVELWSNFSARVANHDTLVSLYAPIYRRHLSRDDICAVVRFYRTPVGAHFLRIDPKIQEETRAAAQAWAARITLELLEPADAARDVVTRDAANSGAAERDAARNDAAAIHDLLRVSGVLAGAQRTIANQVDTLQHGPPAPALPASFWDDARKRLSNEDDLLRLWAPAYARELTNVEVDELLRFYHSPAGAHYVAALPAIQAESLEAGTQLGHEAARRAVREVFGPLPQWRMLHPAPKSGDAAAAGQLSGSSSAELPGTAGGQPKVGAAP